MADAKANVERLAERAEHLIRIFRPRKPIECMLDMGCGTGTITRSIQEHYNIPEAFGIDLYPAPAEGKVIVWGGNASAGHNGGGSRVSTPPPAAVQAAPARRPPPPMAIDFDDDGPASPPAPPPPPPPPPPPAPPAEKKQMRYEYRQLEGDVVPLPDSSVDLITCFMAIHHFEKFDVMISELKRVLKPTGFLFIREHDVSPTDALLRKSLDNMHANFSDHMTSGTLHYWSREDLKTALVDRFGLKHVLDDDYPPGVANPQSIYHSLYAKEATTELKYVPPAERSTKQGGPATGFKGAKGKTSSDAFNKLASWR